MKVQVENLSFGYGDHQVLHGIDLTMDGPGLVCIIGPNGVGKSTLVKCIDGLLKPSEGKVTIDDADISTLSKADIADRISYVPASGFDCFSMPVIDAILVGRHNKQKWKTSEKDLRIVYDAMDMLGITDLAMQGSNELSAGQHQKVALARGIVQDTDIMILDEPTANLDVHHQIYVTQLLRAFADMEGKLVIMICHDLNIAARYASEVVVMAPPGVIDSIGSPEKVITREMIERIYNVSCEILTYEGKPLVIMKSTFGDSDELVDAREALRMSEESKAPADAVPDAQERRSDCRPNAPIKRFTGLPAGPSSSVFSRNPCSVLMHRAPTVRHPRSPSRTHHPRQAPPSRRTPGPA